MDDALVSPIRKLDERRKANSIWGSDERIELRRIRLDATRVEQGFKGNPIGVPTLLLGGAFVTSAAIARRRIRLTTQQPIQTLYDVIGAAGNPPHDQSYNPAATAIILLVLSWAVVPPIVCAACIN